jgi:hypothetical protein
VGIAAAGPIDVAARASLSVQRNSFDLLNLEITFPELRAFLQVGLGEAVERRETLLAATSRKAYIDEINQTTPVRLVDDAPSSEARVSARWLACPAPSAGELARQQCIAFLNATLRPKLAAEEAQVWRRSLDVMSAMERSLDRYGVAVPVTEPADAGLSGLRLIVPDAA